MISSGGFQFKQFIYFFFQFGLTLKKSNWTKSLETSFSPSSLDCQQKQPIWNHFGSLQIYCLCDSLDFEKHLSTLLWGAGHFELHTLTLQFPTHTLSLTLSPPTHSLSHHTHTHTCTHTLTVTHTNTNTHTHTCTHTYTNTHTHTNTHTQTQTDSHTNMDIYGE